MANQRRIDDDEEEYQFPSSEFGEHKPSESEMEEAPTEEEVDRSSRTQATLATIKEKVIENKRLVAIVGIVIVIFIAFNLMRPHHTTRVIEETPPQSQAQQPANTQLAPSPSSATIPEESINNLRQAAAGSVELTRLQHVSSNEQTQLTQLQNQISGLQGNLQQLKKSQQQLTSQVQEFNSQFKELTSQLLTAVTKPSATTPGPQPQVQLMPYPVYHMRAVIPGRAWLEDDQGQSLSVAVGDRLPGYGKVTAINSQQGYVATNLGKVIRFNE